MGPLGTEQIIAKYLGIYLVLEVNGNCNVPSFCNFSVLNFVLDPDINRSLCCFVTTKLWIPKELVPKSRGKQMKLGVYFSRTPMNLYAFLNLVRQLWVCRLVSSFPFCACFGGFSFMLGPSQPSFFKPKCRSLLYVCKLCVCGSGH